MKSTTIISIIWSENIPREIKYHIQYNKTCVETKYQCTAGGYCVYIINSRLKVSTAETNLFRGILSSNSHIFEWEFWSLNLTHLICKDNTWLRLLKRYNEKNQWQKRPIQTNVYRLNPLQRIILRIWIFIIILGLGHLKETHS